MTSFRSIGAPLRAARRTAIAIATLSLAACDLGWDCGTVATTMANGTLRDAANASLATVQVSLTEDVPTRFRLGAGVMGPAGSAGAPLKGRVTRARLIAENGDLIAEIPTGTSTLYLDAVVALSMDLPSRNDYARVRGQLLTGRAKVILETDLVGREQLETVLVDARETPGEVGRCRPA